RFQGKGFGKFMLRFAVDYLRKAGAKKLSIGVNRFNIPARNLYKSVGYTEDCVYEEGVFMTQNLE
ncbi:MAG: GNAT family N-acetyltransferase, partial [Oscillospiraceae bacterium]|nr:GNAT family N-acetyltransferase [Oscillospiraceae bacterium]